MHGFARPALESGFFISKTRFTYMADPCMFEIHRVQVEYKT